MTPYTHGRLSLSLWRHLDLNLVRCYALQKTYQGLWVFYVEPEVFLNGTYDPGHTKPEAHNESITFLQTYSYMFVKFLLIQAKRLLKITDYHYLDIL